MGTIRLRRRLEQLLASMDCRPLLATAYSQPNRGLFWHFGMTKRQRHGAPAHLAVKSNSWKLRAEKAQISTAAYGPKPKCRDVRDLVTIGGSGHDSDIAKVKRLTHRRHRWLRIAAVQYDF